MSRVAFYAILEHPEKWYLLWARSYDDKTWHVHAKWFDKKVAAVDIDSEEFTKKDYGDFNRKYDEESEARDKFYNKLLTRKRHGYKVVKIYVPDSWGIRYE